MSEPQSTLAPRGKRDRSPSFPFIPLKTAIERLEAMEKHFGRHPTPTDHVGSAWGMKGQSSQADQTLAALRSYGLVEYEGIGAKRVVTISEDARKYLRAQQELIKEAIRKAAALRPRVIRKFWATWGADRPVDAVALDILVLQNAFSDNGAKAFLRVYDETVSYAGLGDSDKVVENDQEPSEAEMSQAGHGATDQRTDHLGVVANRLLDEVVTSVQYPQAKSPILQEIFNLDEGPVTLSFPSGLSPASFQDLQSYLQLFLRKAQRRAGVGDYFAEIYAPDGIKAKEVHYFDGFHDLKRFVDRFKERASTDVLRVHLPARATDDERRIMAESGAVPV